MKLSQILHAMDRDETIIVNTCRDVPYPDKNLYRGTVRGIQDSPLNRAHVKLLMAVDDSILVEIYTEEAEMTAKWCCREIDRVSSKNGREIFAIEHDLFGRTVLIIGQDTLAELKKKCTESEKDNE